MGKNDGASAVNTRSSIATEDKIMAVFNTRFDELSKQMLQIDGRLDAFEKKMTSVIAEKIDEKLNEFDSTLGNRIVLCMQSQDVMAEIVPMLRPHVGDSVKAETKDLRDQLAALQREMAKLQDHSDHLEQYGRRWNLVFHGIAESEGENCEKKVLNVIHDTLEVKAVSSANIQRSHRLGKRSDGHTRPIIVRFASYKDRAIVFAAKKKFKEKGVKNIFVTENLTAKNLSVLKYARSLKKFHSVWSYDGNLFVSCKGNDRIQIRSQNDVRDILRSQNL